MPKKTKKEYKSFTVRVQEKTFTKLKNVAESRKRSLNFVCNEYLEKMLKFGGE